MTGTTKREFISHSHRFVRMNGPLPAVETAPAVVYFALFGTKLHLIFAADVAFDDIVAVVVVGEVVVVVAAEAAVTDVEFVD